MLNLGIQKLTGVLPRRRGDDLIEGPLEIVWCPDSGLLQLRHSYDSAEMYGGNYGYRSGLNPSMVRHLNNKARSLQRLRPLVARDVVVDIGSNDATTLKASQTLGVRRIGIDPTGAKFRENYGNDIDLIPEFFSVVALRARCADKARIIRGMAEILADDGIWHFEQSYMPSISA